MMFLDITPVVPVGSRAGKDTRIETKLRRRAESNFQKSGFVLEFA